MKKPPKVSCDVNSKSSSAGFLSSRQKPCAVGRPSATDDYSIDQSKR
jgi:hypothetical protein